MNNFHGLARNFHRALPAVREWVEMTLENAGEKARPLMDFRFRRLENVFPTDLLLTTKVVLVDGEVPFPPLSLMGLPELAPVELMSKGMSGVTYSDTFFVRRHRITESLCFHELVHVVQWETLGMDDFLLAYGAGLIKHGYRNSPLEQMAYELQERFDRDELTGGVADLIRRETGAIRKEPPTSAPSWN